METNEKNSRPRSREYPAISLNQAIDYIMKIKSYPPNKPIAYSILANEHGLRNTSTRSFAYAVSTARQFGLITVSGQTLTLTDNARLILYPTNDDPTAILGAKMDCFKKPNIYAELINDYNNRSLPSQSILENLLVTQHGIIDSVKGEAATAFLASANDAGAIVNGVFSVDVDFNEDNTVENISVEQNITKTSQQEKPNVTSATIEKESTNLSGQRVLNIPIADKADAKLYIPSDITLDDVEYIKSMIDLMLKNYVKSTSVVPTESVVEE